MTLPAAWGLAMLVGLACPALAGECRLALVLALDVSGSVDKVEDRFQREGLAQALVAPQVVQAFLAGDPVALYVFQWAGEDSQVALLPGWHMIRSGEDLAHIAAIIAATEPIRLGSLRPMATAVGDALDYAARALSQAPACQARTVDVAGDGTSNYGIAPQAIYSRGLFDGVTVNALVIGGAQSHGAAPADNENAALVAWFEAEVLHGPGAFWILADGYEDFERAMRAKLLRELQTPMVSGSPLAGGGA